MTVIRQEFQSFKHEKEISSLMPSFLFVSLLDTSSLVKHKMWIIVIALVAAHSAHAAGKILSLSLLSLSLAFCCSLMVLSCDLR